MEIQSEEDDWNPSESNEEGPSLFKKVFIDFSDQKIQQNLNKQLSHPVYHLEQTQDDSNQQQLDEEQQFDFKPIHKNKFEALYDPIEDDDNQIWMKNQIKRNSNKCLSCPSCFMQISHSYKFLPDQKYLAKKAHGIQILENKIIRDRFCAQTMIDHLKIDAKKQMDILLGNSPMIDLSRCEERQKSHTINAKNQRKQTQRILSEREQQFNIKMLCICECGADIGYYDVNQQAYILINVII